MSIFSQVLFSRSEVVLVEKSPLYFVLKAKRQKETGKDTLMLGQQ